MIYTTMKFPEGDMDSRLERIYELKLQLLQLGYHGFQVDAMIKEVIGSATPEEIDAAQRLKLIEALEKYAYFALKARRGGDARRNPGPR